jgi:hypothetical protein
VSDDRIGAASRKGGETIANPTNNPVERLQGSHIVESFHLAVGKSKLTSQTTHGQGSTSHAVEQQQTHWGQDSVKLNRAA